MENKKDNIEMNESSKLIWKGLEIAEYRMIREKAMKNETLVQNDKDGNVIEVSAREVFVRLYNEAVPSY